MTLRNEIAETSHWTERTADSGGIGVFATGRHLTRAITFIGRLLGVASVNFMAFISILLSFDRHLMRI